MGDKESSAHKYTWKYKTEEHNEEVEQLNMKLYFATLARKRK